VAGDSRDERALTAVRQLRERDVPEIFGGLRATVLVTGETAEEIDYTDLMETWLPRIIAFVLALSFILL
jgi:RND superfamily putative drug exporter